MTNTTNKQSTGMTRELITKELTKNDNKMLNAFITGHVDEKYFLKKYKTTRQHFYNIVTAIDPDIYEKRKEREKNLYQDLYNQALEGIAFEEILKDKEISMSCILIDKNDVSYATGSKVFTIQMMRYIEMFGIKEDGFLIKIVKNKQSSGNKTLGFELV